MQINRQQLSILKRSQMRTTEQDMDRLVKFMMYTEDLENHQKVIGVLSKMKDGSKILRMAKVLIDDFEVSNDPNQEFAAQIALNRALELGEDFQKQASQKDDLLDTIVVQAKNDDTAYQRRDAKKAVDNAWADYIKLLVRGKALREELNSLNKLFHSFVRREAIRQVAQIWKEEEDDPGLNEF